MKTRVIGASAGLLLASCMSAQVIPPAQPLPPLAPLEVALSVPPAMAYDRVVGAITTAGLTVGTADRQAGLVKTLGMPGPTSIASGLAVATLQTTEYVRAVILPAGEGSRVLLSTTMSGTMTGGHQVQQYEEQPLGDCRTVSTADAKQRQTCLDALARVQQRLERIAAELRKAGSSSP